MANPDAPSRMDQIVKVDTKALLSTIKELESKLSEYHRQDKQPGWATTFASRIDSLESNAKLTAERNRGPRSEISVSDLSNEEKILSKLRVEMDTELGSATHTLEAKMSSVNLELERLQKLLQIRPTTSELQHVVLTVQDIDRKVQDSMSDMGSRISATVQDKLSLEMASLLHQLKNNEAVSDENVGMLAKKVKSFGQDISDVRVGVENGFKDVQIRINQLTSTLGSAASGVNDVKKHFDEESAKIYQGLEEMRRAQSVAADHLADYRQSVSSRLSGIDDLLKSQYSTIEEISVSASKKIDGLTAQLTGTDNHFAQFKTKYERDQDDLKHINLDFHSSLSTVCGRQKTVEGIVDKMQELDVMGKVLQHSDALLKNYSITTEHSANISCIFSRLDTMLKTMGGIEDDMNKLPGALQAHTDRLDLLAGDANVLGDTVRGMGMSLSQAERDIAQLQKICEEVPLLREASNAADQRQKSQQTAIMGILENIDDHENRIEQIIEAIERADEGMTKKITDLRVSLTDLLMEKQAEMDAVVQNMKDNLDIMSLMGDAQHPANSQGQAGAPKNRSSIAGSVVKGGGSVSTSNHDLSGVAMTAEEQRAMALNQAQFISDLCMNFEEISIRKTFVPEIPPSMCEHMTATCQQLTAFVATCTDAEMVQRMLKDGPGDIHYDEHVVTDRRQQKLEEFLQEVRALLDINNMQPGMVRLDAREKFLKQLKKALQLCMSKHDQVLVVGNSRLGKLKIPTCIACDRPLLEKVSKDTQRRPDDRMREQRESHGLEGDFGNSSVYSQMSSATSPPGTRGTVRLPTTRHDHSINQILNGSLKSTLIDYDAAPTATTNSNSLHVLRGGFKMPKPKPSNMSTSRSVSNMSDDRNVILPDMKIMRN